MRILSPSPRAPLPLLSLLLALTLAGTSRAETIKPQKLAATKGGTLYAYGKQRVLVVRGDPRTRGLAHGKLLKDEVRAVTKAFLDEWALRRMGRKRKELQDIWNRVAPFVPRRYHEELAGLAEGSGVPLNDLQLVHAIPSRYHCTGVAATPAVTKDKKVYHTRSLDYALDIGATVRPQTHALLCITVPDRSPEGHSETEKGGGGGAGALRIPHAIVGWAGFIGCVTGLNTAGVSVGEMGSRSSDETYDGVPMIFALRMVLDSAHTLKQAQTIWQEVPRTCGYNFIFCDAAEVCAVESNRSRVRFFAPGDEGQGTAPHFGIKGIVRRCNHFIDPELAATQRRRYDPRRSAASSWTAYERQGNFVRSRSGRIDAATMIAVLRGYPATHPCLHQAVMCPTDKTIWVSHAADSARDPLAGAQNQPFLRYDLKELVAGNPMPAEVARNSRQLNKKIETGVIRGERVIPGLFGHKPAEVPYALAPVRQVGKVRLSRLTYASPGPSRFPENLTVHAEYFRPEGKGPFPSVVVLHILDGRFYVARLVANSLAQNGVAALFIKLPYYGERRPAAGFDPRAIKMNDVKEGLVQAVRDVRRGAAWLRGRPEVARGRVGITGVSLGAFAATLAAGADGGFDRCAFVLGGGSITETVFSGSKDTRKAAAELKKRGWTKERLQKELARFEPIAWAKHIKKDGVLMINCRHDEVVPPATSRALWEAIGRPEIVWYDGGHYAIKGKVFEVLGRLVNHFRDSSRDSSTAKRSAKRSEKRSEKAVAPAGEDSR